jgi:hypothetical protein
MNHRHLLTAAAFVLSTTAWAQTADQAAPPAVPAPAPPKTSAPAVPAAPGPADAPQSQQTPCRQLLVAPSSRNTIQTNINVATRLHFPTPVATYEVSTPGLWEASTKGQDLWVRPKTPYSSANKTGLTVILDDETRYDFLAVSTERVPASCITIHDQVPKKPKSPQPSAEAAEATHAAAELLVTQKHQFQAELAELRSQVTQQAADRIKAFQYSINTRYDWNSSASADKNLINAVYDDGRSTYIRITTSAYGLPAVSGALGDKDVLLEGQYDDLTGVFEIPGLYDRLRIRLGSHELIIARQG